MTEVNVDATLASVLFASILSANDLTVSRSSVRARSAFRQSNIGWTVQSFGAGASCKFLFPWISAVKKPG